MQQSNVLVVLNLKLPLVLVCMTKDSGLREVMYLTFKVLCLPSLFTKLLKSIVSLHIILNWEFVFKFCFTFIIIGIQIKTLLLLRVL